jgi:hypothetical protein
MQERNYISNISNLPPLASLTRERIERLRTLEEGWNGYDVAAPKPQAIEYALSWIELMFGDVLSASMSWKEPHVAADEEGNVLFEWWNDDKMLSIYVSEKDVSYVSAWGADIINEMEDGMIETFSDCIKVWKWLMD